MNQNGLVGPTASVTDARRVSPLDEANRVLLEAVHPADWVNPEPRAVYDSALGQFRRLLSSNQDRKSLALILGYLAVSY